MDFFLNLRKVNITVRTGFYLYMTPCKEVFEKRYSFYLVSETRMKCMLKVLYLRLLYAVAYTFNFKFIY